MFPTLISSLQGVSMKTLCFALVGALLSLSAFYGVAQAQDYVVPVTLNNAAYTLTISVRGDAVTVQSGSPDLRVGTVTEVKVTAVTAGGADLSTLKASAVSVPYDDLFRYNEQHVGKFVRFVGKVMQAQKNICLLCDNPGYILRVAVTKGSYDLWDDPIWVDYPGTSRFLEDDIVTLWGTVTGLKTYEAVLGNSITIPLIEALDIQLGEVAGAVTPAGGSRANKSANLRGGPGTSYALAGGVDEAQALTIVARNADASWYLLEGGQWIAAFLVVDGPDGSTLPVAQDIPAAPTTVSAQTADTATAPATPVAGSASATPGTVGIGQEIQGSGWRFKVSEVHKRKAVYFYSSSHIAMGHYLIVILDAVNEQSGTDTFDSNVAPRLVDESGYEYDHDWRASSNAQWQYGGISSIYTDVNPGNFVRIALAYDLPDNTGDVYLKSDLPTTIQLGNFSQLATEDN